MDHDPFDLTGDVLDGQFRVDSFAGEGDLSVVYKGHHLGVDAPVAIKCLNLPATLNPALARPLVDGFKEASRVHYKLARGNLNIAQSIASGTTLVPRSGAVVPYMVREWFDGESLASNLTRRRTEKSSGRSIQEALTLLETAFDGVAFAHQQGEVHLSINPSNLFLARRGESTTLKVLDFGIARTMNDLTIGPSGAHAEGGLRVLFPTYAAPEQLDKSIGKPGPWTDVYALALITMEVLSDRIVMAELETGAIVERALDPNRRPGPRAHGLKLPANLDLVLTRAVMRAPTRRHESAAALWRDIKSAVRPTASRPIQAVTAAPPVTKAVSPASGPEVETATAFDSVPTGVLVRPKTLMGVGAAVAVGALGHRSRLPSTPSVETKPMSFEPRTSPSGVDLGVGLALASAPVAAPSSVVDEPLFVPRPVLAVARAHAGAMVQRLLRLRDWLRQRAERYEPRTRLLVAVGFGSSALLLAVVVTAHAWHHGGPSPAPSATAAAPVLPPPAPEPEPPPPTPPPAPTRPFNAYAARRSLDGTSRDILSCRRDKKWGVALATVTFANDGSVKDVAVGVPFRGTPAGDCVAEDLSTAHVPPYAGKEGVIVYQFFVALKGP